MAGHSGSHFYLSIREAGAGELLGEFEASPLYIDSSRTARDTVRDCLKRYTYVIQIMPRLDWLDLLTW